MLLRTLLLVPLLSLLAAFSVAAERPNIIVILSDDMGFSDIGCYGGEIQTPNLDGLAKKGLRFTQFYNTARCCPTRASLLTGLYPHQAGVGHMTDDRGHDGYRGDLNRNCLTIAEALRPAGYKCYMAGKWHVTKSLKATTDADRHNWPRQRGFDRFYGTIIGGGSYWDPAYLTRDNMPVSAFNDPEYQPAEGFYYTDALADQAVRFVREHQTSDPGKPFFLYLAFTAAHWPMHARESDIAKYQGRYDAGYQAVRDARYARMLELGVIKKSATTGWLIPDNLKEKEYWEWDRRNMEVYAAMVDRMDQGIGKMISELKKTGQLENTLICFLQDNGGCAENMGRAGKGEVRAASPTLPPLPNGYLQPDLIPKQSREGFPIRQGKGVMAGGPDTYLGYGQAWATVSNTPFREYKHWTHEGGISTPLIVHWPTGLAESVQGQLEHQPAHLIDIMATCVDLAGVTYPQETGGKKLKPLQGISLRPTFSAQLLKRAQPIFWEHEGNRAVREGRWKLVAKEGQPWELYDMDTDRSEQHDLAAAQPERVKDLSAKWEAYAAKSDVLPLGAWKKAAGTRNGDKVNAATHFSLRGGEKLDQAAAPAVAGRGFSLEVKFSTPESANGVLVAQGGATHGYTLYAAGGQLHFAIRRGGKLHDITCALPAGSHLARVRLTPSGVASLQIGNQPAVEKEFPGPLSAMPKDGLEVGSDVGGLVGPYQASNAFNGPIESVVIDLK